MPDIRPHLDVLDNPIDLANPRTVLFWDGTFLRAATVDITGHLQIDVLTVAGLEGALQSVDTDRLIVRGEDQLFSFAGVLAEARSVVISGAGGYVDSDPCIAGEIWCVTGIFATDRTSATTRHEFGLFHDAIYYPIGESVAAFAALDPSFWDGWKWLDPSDTIRVYFAGGMVGDTCDVYLTGYRMTLET